MTHQKRTRVPREKAQEIILNAAEELFYNEGIHAVSVDAVVERAGLNKMSVYRQFSSKTELALAYLERKQQAFWTEWEESMAKHPDQPREQLIQYFTDLKARASSEQFRGCCFINLAVEFPDRAHPVRQLVCSHQKKLLSRFLDLTTLLEAEDPHELAYSLLLLMEGAYSDSQTFGTDSPAIELLPVIAQRLIDSSIVSKA